VEAEARQVALSANTSLQVLPSSNSPAPGCRARPHRSRHNTGSACGRADREAVRPLQLASFSRNSHNVLASVLDREPQKARERQPIAHRLLSACNTSILNIRVASNGFRPALLFLSSSGVSPRSARFQRALGRHCSPQPHHRCGHNQRHPFKGRRQLTQLRQLPYLPLLRRAQRPAAATYLYRPTYASTLAGTTQAEVHVFDDRSSNQDPRRL
jgi:hypothetical protein